MIPFGRIGTNETTTMGMSYTARLFKPRNEPNIKRVVIAAATKIGAYAASSHDKTDTNLLRIGERSGTYTAELPYQDGDGIFFRELALGLGGVWIEARIQEGSHWDYTLSYGLRTLDQFSTLPEYWESDPLVHLALAGRPQLLARAWDIPVGDIDQYHRQWGMRVLDDDSYETTLKGKAYPTDRFDYGQYDQIFDFLEKLSYSTSVKWCFSLKLPPRNHSPKRDFIGDLSTSNKI